jgi:hypothetical protein
LTEFGERFLVSPSMFPARIAGEPFGSSHTIVDLPGDVFAIEGLDDPQLARLTERFATRISSLPGTFGLQMFRASASDFLTIDTAGWEYRVDLEFTPDGFNAVGIDFMARVDLSGRRCGIWCAGDPLTTWSIVENVLRPLVAIRLFDSGGLLVHSASVVLEDRGLLFAGRSGAGKSTISAAALRDGHAVVSDDLNAVVRDSDRFILAPIPFTGDVHPGATSRHQARLTAIVDLAKGDRETLVPIRQVDAAALLVRCAPYVNLSEQRAARLLERAGEIAGSVATVRLTWRAGADVWPILAAL